jgi:carotenoid cleavage dioxygenase
MHGNDSENKPQPALERRSFIRTATAALSATAAGSAAAFASNAPMSDSQPIAQKLAMMEDADAIRKLQYAYTERLNDRRYESIVHLFAPESEVRLWGGAYIGKEEGVRRLYVSHFAKQGRSTAGVQGPMHDYLLSHNQHLDTIELAPDRRTARGRFHYLARTETAVSSSLPIVDMARQQGQGTLNWWEPGVFENTYVRVGSAWLIGQLLYRSTGPADNMLERVCTAAPVAVAFTSTYPHNPTGPDRLIEAV